MDVQSAVKASLAGNDNLLNLALQGLSDGDLHKSPNNQTNPIGWLYWHQNRVEDFVLSLIDGKNQVWIGDKWSDKFGMSGDPGNTGVGYTMDQVFGFKASGELIRGYAQAVRTRTLSTLDKLTPADVDREIDTPFGRQKVGQFLGGWLVDLLQHSGQVCYVRGFITGRGWLPM